MKKNLILASFALAALVAATLAIGQGSISSVSFDEVPEGTELAGGGQPIQLQADTQVAGTVTASGEVVSGAGVRFPDGTLQVTASTEASNGFTANAGLYSNTIADFSPPNAYTEICIKAGVVEFDIHDAGEATAGGDCVPGDTGWIIERFERGGLQLTWAGARLECLRNGMRLPEIFEWQISCEDDDIFALSDMIDDREWTSNSAQAVDGSMLLAAGMGLNSCAWGAGFRVANSSGTQSTIQFRCAR